MENEKLMERIKKIEELYGVKSVLEDKEGVEYALIGQLMHNYKLIDYINFKPDYFSTTLFKAMYEFILKERENNIETFDLMACMKCLGLDAGGIDVVLNMHEQVIGTPTKDTVKHYAKIVLNNYTTECLRQIQQKQTLGLITTKEFYEKLTDLSNLTIDLKIESITDDDLDKALNFEETFIHLNSFKQLSNVLKLTSNDTVTVAGLSGFGKSAFMINIYNELALDKNKNCKCQYYNLEVNHSTLIQRLVAVAIDTPMWQIVGKRGVNQDVDNNVNMARCLIKQSDSFIKSGTTTIEKLKSNIIDNLAEEKQNVVFIDHVGLISCEDKFLNQNEYARLTHCVKELRGVCLDYNVLIFFVSQFDRDSVKNNKLTMHSLKGSGEIENSSTQILLLQESHERESPDPAKWQEVAIDVAKNRSGVVRFLDNYTFFKDKQKFVEKI